MLTAGWIAQAEPSPPPPGWVEKTTWVAGPAEMVKSLLVPALRVPEEALSE